MKDVLKEKLTSGLKRLNVIKAFPFVAGLGLGFPFLISIMLRQILFSQPLITIVVVFLYGAFALTGLMLFILLISGLSSKFLWYFSIAYWGLLFAFSLIYNLSNLASFEKTAYQFFYSEILVPYVCSTICIISLSTKKTREYFHFTTNAVQEISKVAS